MEIRSKLIVIAGGSASGKSTVAHTIANEILENESVVHISIDSYYKEYTNLSLSEREKLNFDHPNSIDIELLIKHLDMLMNGDSIELPIYDFTKHSRKKEKKLIKASDVIILDGILALHIEEIRKRADIKLFIKTDDDVRFIRRLVRDVEERGRSLQNVVKQYIDTVRPMHKFFVEPSIEYADIIIPYYEGNAIAVSLIATTIKSLLNKNN